MSGGLGSAARISLTLWRLAPAAVCLAIALSVAPTAHAKVRHLSASFKGSASDGERIEVDTSAHGIRVALLRGPLSSGHLEISEYKVHGIPESRDGIEADLGRFGKINLRFHPSGRTQVRRNPAFQDGCKGARKIIRKLGTFVGVIRFESEDGRATFVRSRVQGSIGTPATVVCSLTVGARASSQKQDPEVILGSTERGNRLGFAAARGGELRQASYTAMMKRRIGRVSYQGWVTVHARPRTFSVASNLKSAEIDPPRPFSGRAVFSKEAEDKPFEVSLTSGSLFVKFPGMVPVPLTGARFKYLLLKGP